MLSPTVCGTTGIEFVTWANTEEIRYMPSPAANGALT